MNSLNIDQSEAEAIDAVLADCSSVEHGDHGSAGVRCADRGTYGCGTNGHSHHHGGCSGTMWDDNDNGKISCAEAQKHGIAPVRLGHPAYEYMTDRDKDGIVCEN